MSKAMDEIDALVAVHVMGFDDDHMGRQSMIHLNDNWWQPTRRIEQAWEVISVLARDEWKATIYAGDQKQSCVLFKYHYSFLEQAETAPLAICMAALKAKGIDV
jgi:hypothetical protein